MFSFNSRKKQLEVQRFLRRVIDTTTPNLPPASGNSRVETRYNRSAVVLLIPFDDEVALPEQAIAAVTKDLSGSGIALVLSNPIQAKRVVIGFLLQSLPGFALGEVRQNLPLGGGFWQLGVELVEMLSPQTCPALEAVVPLVEQLAPDAEQTELAH